MQNKWKKSALETTFNEWNLTDFFLNFRMQRKQMIDSGEKLSWTEPDKAWLEPIDSANNGNYFMG